MSHRRELGSSNLSWAIFLPFSFFNTSAMNIYLKQPVCEILCGPIKNGRCEKSCEYKGKGNQEIVVMLRADVEKHCSCSTVV